MSNIRHPQVKTTSTTNVHRQYQKNNKIPQHRYKRTDDKKLLESESLAQALHVANLEVDTSSDIYIAKLMQQQPDSVEFVSEIQQPSNTLKDEELARLLEQEEEAALFASYSGKPTQVSTPVKRQLATDEQIAKQLQQEEEKQLRLAEFAEVPTYNFNTSRHTGGNMYQYTAPPVRHISPDRIPRPSKLRATNNVPPQNQDVDVDNMSYEQLLELEEKMGKVKKGVSVIDLSSLPIHQYSQKNGTTENCSICCEDFTDKDRLRTLPCFHNFHVACIDEWLKDNKTCPFCMKEVSV